MKNQKDISDFDKISVLNPATGQILVVSGKQWRNLYKDKGFEMVDRNNVDRAANGAEKTGGEKPVETGSAASIAKTLGLEKDAGNPNPDSAATERDSAKRDRGRG